MKANRRLNALENRVKGQKTDKPGWFPPVGFQVNDLTEEEHEHYQMTNQLPQRWQEKLDQVPSWPIPGNLKPDQLPPLRTVVIVFPPNLGENVNL